MPSDTGLSPSTSITRIDVDIRTFPWIRRLAADYAFDYGRLADFFAGNPADPAAWQAAIDRAQRQPRERAMLATVLTTQLDRRGAPPAAVDAARQLGHAGTVAVVTGQQAGLFGGPLYTLLKALTAIRVAETVREQHGVPVVPVFWVEAEDHDWDEVKGCAILDAADALYTVSLGDPSGAHERPVARVSLDGSVDAALADLASHLPQTEWTADLLASLRTIYTAGTGMAEACARWLDTLLGPRGLVVYDASDPAAKPLAAPVFARELDELGETSRLARAAGAALEGRGYHAQTTPAETSIALFHLDGRREPIAWRAKGVLIGGQEFSRESLISRVQRDPHEFSPNVLLRPLVQDAIFPTICYVAGPSELAYLGQLRGVYARFGIPMPLIAPRATATLLDGNALRFLGRQDLPLASLRAQDESALNALLQAQLPAGVESALRQARAGIGTTLSAIAAEVRQVDATLEGAATSTRSRMLDDLGRLENKVVQAAKRKDETLRRQFQHARALAFPGGHPQERAVSFLTFLNRVGPSLVDRLLDELPLPPGMHAVIAT